MTEWQPMDTVPKDGSWVLLDMSYWYPDDDSITEVYVVGYWLGDVNEEYPWYCGDESYRTDSPRGWMEIPPSSIPKYQRCRLTV